MSVYAALAGRIRQALLDLDQVAGRTEELFEKAQRMGDDGYLDGVALNLHGFYSGVERIFEDIAREIDGSVPMSPHWHQDLLLQMAAPLSEIRPAVITAESRRCLDDYRGFRHLVRNVYTFNLRPSRLKELTEELRTCYQLTVRDLESFVVYLEQLDREL